MIKDRETSAIPPDCSLGEGEGRGEGEKEEEGNKGGREGRKEGRRSKGKRDRRGWKKRRGSWEDYSENCRFMCPLTHHN